MEFTTIIGLIAAIFTTISLFPQLIKVWQTKTARDISAGMFAFFGLGVFLWFVYGVFVNDLPIILANSIAFVQAMIILFFKVKYR